MYRVAIDVGGTFTDLSLYRESDGAVFDHKTASTPQDPSIAIARGLRELLGAHDAPGDEVAHFAHGTTVATNMLIERRGAATGLLTTAGFRDVAEIGRQIRPALYDYSQSKPTPIARRRDRAEVNGRIDVDGSELVPLSKDDVERACRAFNALGIESVAICFLHAYRNANHEEQARAWVAQWMPNAFVSVSSAVNPEFREFERTATTLANAYVGPRMSRYLARLQ
ncbi:MAG: hydantoinase/oxoprolinase N-terminal domain-containing protein, partial [Pseudomonadota bacterium]